MPAARSSRPGTLRPAAEGHLEGLAAAVALDDDLDLVTGLLALDRHGDVVGARDALARHLDDHVAVRAARAVGGLQARLLARASRAHLADDGAKHAGHGLARRDA